MTLHDDLVGALERRGPDALLALLAERPEGVPLPRLDLPSHLVDEVLLVDLLTSPHLADLEELEITPAYRELPEPPGRPWAPPAEVTVPRLRSVILGRARLVGALAASPPLPALTALQVSARKPAVAVSARSPEELHQLFAWPGLRSVRSLAVDPVDPPTLAALLASPERGPLERLALTLLRARSWPPPLLPGPLPGLRALTVTSAATPQELVDGLLDGVTLPDLEDLTLHEALAWTRPVEGPGTLRRLQVGFVDDSPDTSGPLARSSALRGVRELLVACSALPAEGVGHLGDELSELRALRLHRCGVDGAAVRALVEAPWFRKLERLDLGSNALGDAGALALASSPHLRSLEALDLFLCDIGRDGLEALRRALPKRRFDEVRRDNPQDPKPRAPRARAPGPPLLFPALPADLPPERVRPAAVLSARAAARPGLNPCDTWFGGNPSFEDGEAWPTCSSCDRPLDAVFQANLDRLWPGPPPYALVTLFYCWGCGPWRAKADGAGWRLRTREAVDPARHVHVERPPGIPDAIDPGRATAQAGWSVPDGRDLPEGEAPPARVGRKLPISGDRSWIGGFPQWIQEPEHPACETCAAPMRLLFQLGNEPQVELCWFDTGAAMVFFCPEHRAQVALVVQSC